MTYENSKRLHADRNAPEVLAARRHVLGLAREKVAARAGLSDRTIYNLESGRVAPQLGTVLALALALGLTAEDVIAESEQFERLVPETTSDEASE